MFTVVRVQYLIRSSEQEKYLFDYRLKGAGNRVALLHFMKHRLYNYDAKVVRDTLNKAIEKSDKIHQLEKELISLLKEVDERRFYVRYGYKSLMGFCNFGLRFSRTQTYRIVTEVRRSLTTVNIRPAPAISESYSEPTNLEN